MVKKNKYSNSRSRRNRHKVSSSRSRTSHMHILYDKKNKFMNINEISPQFQYNILSNSSISPDSLISPNFERLASPQYESESDYDSNDSDSDAREDRENIGNENKINYQSSN